ncbi:serine carboxypeptidase [Aureococcus anophagefferens]|nr:serine carboxypeptidase [Aureococcus anophagefferens]
MRLRLLALVGALVDAKRIHPRRLAANASSAARRLLADDRWPTAALAWNATRRLTSEKLVAPAAHAVTRLPGLPADWAGNHYAGMIDSDDKGGGRLFYWFFERGGKPAGPKQPPAHLAQRRARLLVHGRPLPRARPAPGRAGVAERQARLEGGELVAPQRALFLDQPVGTGFSRTSGRNYCRDDACIVTQFETFLARFVRSYKHLVMKDEKTSVPVYFAGESHAGHYVPLMMEHLLFKATSGINWDVRGAALGNAWIDPRHQYDVSRMASTLGLISDREAARLQEKEKQCQRKLDQRVYVSKLCWDLLDDVVKAARRPALGPAWARTSTTRDAVRSSRFFPPGHEGVEAYMNQADTDLICNHVGVDRSLRALDWTGKADFARAEARPWLRSGHVAGFLKRARNLALLAVKDSGHMVPMDQPAAALDMMRPSSATRPSRRRREEASFDATAALDEIRNNPEVQRKMRDMMQDPEALAELSELMKDPAFKAQAEADMEYEKYRSQFTGEQNAAKGLEAIVGAAKDPERLADAMRDLNDPEMMKAAHEMMADPSTAGSQPRGGSGGAAAAARAAAAAAAAAAA